MSSCAKKSSISNRLSATMSSPLVVAMVTLIFLALLSATASARTTRLHQNSFGAGSVRALAVDQSGGDVYAVVMREDFKLVVERFTSNGSPSDFTAGPNAGTNILFEFAPFTFDAEIAIDNSGGPLDGTVYVGDSLIDQARVRVFDRTGEALGTISGSGTPLGGFGNAIRGVAVDQSTGALYLSDGVSFDAHVWRFTPASPSGSVSDADYTLAGLTVGAPSGLAVASDGVYVIKQSESKDILIKYPASSFTTNFSSSPTPTTIDIGDLKLGPKEIAVDPTTDELYVNEGHQIAVYDAAVTRLYSFGAAAYFGNESQALAVKSAASGPASAAYVGDLQAGGGEVDVFGPPALAATFTRPKTFAFGPDGTSGSFFSKSIAVPLAFDQSSRRLYAFDRDAVGIYGFDASIPPSFPPLSGFSPLDTGTGDFAPGLAVDSTTTGSSGNVYFASDEVDLIYGWDASGVPLGGAFPVDPAAAPGAPDGSPKDLCGAAVDSQGSVWVANSSTKRVLKYSPAGASLPGTIETSDQGSPCQLAFDSDDDLYLSVINEGKASQGGIWKYTADSGYASAIKIADGPSTFVHGNLAVDRSNDHLYVGYVSCPAGGNAQCNVVSWIDEYDESGKLVDEFGANRAGPVVVDATSHGVYVHHSGAGQIQTYGPPVLLPEVAARPASNRTNTTATLNGLVNTQTVTLSDCHFEYVTESAFRLTGFSDLSSGGIVSCTPAASSIPLDLEDHPVSADVTGLTENTAYRFRVSASNADGTDVDEGRSFLSAGRPIVETTGSPVRSATAIRFEGRLNAHGEATTYHFEYGIGGPCDADPCEVTESRSAGSSDEIQFVSQQVDGLEPGTTYHYRLIADNGNPLGLGVGNGMTVTTSPSDAPLSHGDLPGPPGSDRAYEHVNLPDTGGNPITIAFGVSDDGNRALYRVAGGTPLSTTGSLFSVLYAERRETEPHEGGWRSQNIGPSRAESVGNNWYEPAGSPDLSDQSAVTTNSIIGVGEVWRLRPGQPATKLFESPTVDNSSSITSKDGSRTVVFSNESLDPGHPLPSSSANAYDVSSGGTPSLLGLMPDGSISPCDASRGALSADGSLYFFQCNANLYMRDIDAEQTKQIGIDSSYAKATPGTVFFTTSQSLELDDTGGRDLYRYDIDDESLECITCAIPGLDPAFNQITISADGSRIYFISPQALLPGAAEQGIYRLNVSNSDLIYVAAAPGAGSPGIGESPSSGQAISPDGSVLVFVSADPRLNAIGGQQNGGTLQYYRYDDRDRSLTCLSCPQDGSEPLAPVESSLLSPAYDEGRGANKTALSADGRTFAFATATPLLGPDQNTARPGQRPQVGVDVYEWRDGRLLLVTDGLTAWPAENPPEVTAITPSGNDIFFVAAAQYTPDALDGYRRLYDARIDGGFEFSSPPQPCPLEVCQGTPRGAPEEQATGTGSFRGPGNAAGPGRRRPSCPKGRRRAQMNGKARCVRSRGKKPDRKRARHDRRGQR
jgi:hypothetical protein